MTFGSSDFARVYEQHVWAVYGFLAYRVGDRGTAEDLTQTTFERALRAWARFDPGRGSERTWLLAIAHHLLIDHHRHNRRIQVAPVEEHMLPSVAGPEESPSASPELTTALAQLGDREREILALRYGGDLSGPEIASMLGLSLANVQQITSRSLRKLRQLLADGDPGPGPGDAPSAITSAGNPRIDPVT